MKKRLLSLLLILMMTLTTAMGLKGNVSAAETDMSGEDGWTVTFNSDAEMVSSFGQEDLDDRIGDMQPGDSIEFKIALKNGYSEATSWYMRNSVISSFEDSKEVAEGGAYSYILSYNGETLYDSTTVGGDENPMEGLHGATDNLKDYFYLDNLQSGQEGSLSLIIILDGETQGNDYMNTLADLNMQFAVELTSVTPDDSSNTSDSDTPGTNKTTIVKTGDETNLVPFFIIGGVSGLLFLLLAIYGVLARKKEKKEAAQ